MSFLHTHTHVYFSKQATRKGEDPIVLATILLFYPRVDSIRHQSDKRTQKRLFDIYLFAVYMRLCDLYIVWMQLKYYVYISYVCDLVCCRQCAAVGSDGSRWFEATIASRYRSLTEPRSLLTFQRLVCRVCAVFRSIY